MCDLDRVASLEVTHHREHDAGSEKHRHRHNAPTYRSGGHTVPIRRQSRTRTRADDIDDMMHRIEEAIAQRTCGRNMCQHTGRRRLYAECERPGLHDVQTGPAGKPMSTAEREQLARHRGRTREPVHARAPGAACRYDRARTFTCHSCGPFHNRQPWRALLGRSPGLGMLVCEGWVLREW